jgi:DNA-binding Lrp family transcriptional regulator
MDKLDRQLLALLQVDAARAHADLAKLVHLSPSQVSRRIARLEADGFIRSTVALLSEAALGLQVEAYVAVAWPVTRRTSCAASTPVSPRWKRCSIAAPPPAIPIISCASSRVIWRPIRG